MFNVKTKADKNIFESGIKNSINKLTYTTF